METILGVTVLLDDGAGEEELIKDVCLVVKAEDLIDVVCLVLVCCLSVVVSTKMCKIE